METFVLQHFFDKQRFRKKMSRSFPTSLPSNLLSFPIIGHAMQQVSPNGPAELWAATIGPYMPILFPPGSGPILAAESSAGPFGLTGCVAWPVPGSNTRKSGETNLVRRYSRWQYHVEPFFRNICFSKECSKIKISIHSCCTESVREHLVQ